MRLMRSFRVSTYLTLGMACISLGYSEIGLLPEIGLITALSVALLGVAYYLEGRWSLSLQDANIVGGILGALLAVWVIYQFIRSPLGLSENLPFPASLLPYLGPVLMILIPAKLFRPKLIGDYWAMHAVGILAIALGCAMANDAFFGVLLIGYLFAFVWSITLFYLGRSAGLLESTLHEPNSRKPVDVEPGISAVTTGPRWWMWRTTFRWSMLVVAVSMALFLITPRPMDNRWELALSGRGRMETGLPDGNIDLNRTGTLDLNEEVAFEVYAEDREGNPVLTLPLDQRWRAATLHYYERGYWLRDRTYDLRLLDPVMQRPPNIEDDPEMMSKSFKELLPVYGPDQLYLTFQLFRGAGPNNLVADPVYWVPGDRPPILLLGPQAQTFVFQRRDGRFEWLPSSRLTNQPVRYVQTLPGNLDRERTPAYRYAGNFQDMLARVPESSRLIRFTNQVIDGLIRSGKLPRAVRSDVDTITGKPKPKYHEAIARALQEYLASSGVYQYTLELRRQDKTIDAVEDFLFNTKAGHCQRFATALALMLRTQGIPSRFVLGYKGCDPRGNGWYDVRQSHAHAWVEALILDSEAEKKLPPVKNDDPSARAYRWLILDPTPGEEASSTSEGISSWWDTTINKGSELFRQFVLTYNAKSQRQTWEAVEDFITDGYDDFVKGYWSWVWLVFITPTILIAFWLLWRYRPSIRKPAQSKQVIHPTQRYFGRLELLLTREGIGREQGETPREYALRAGTILATRSGTADVQSIPLHIVDQYYRVLFGEQKLTPEESLALDVLFHQLEKTLTEARRQASTAR